MMDDESVIEYISRLIKQEDIYNLSDLVIDTNDGYKLIKNNFKV